MGDADNLDTKAGLFKDLSVVVALLKMTDFRIWHLWSPGGHGSDCDLLIFFIYMSQMSQLNISAKMCIYCIFLSKLGKVTAGEGCLCMCGKKKEGEELGCY